MSIKDFLDSHPLAVLIGVGAIVASTSSGITSYIASQHAENEQVKLTAHYNSLEIDYKNEISNLKTRLASIERRVSGEEKSFLALTNLLLSPSQVRELGASYESYASESYASVAFFLSADLPDNWTYSYISEKDFMQQIMGKKDSLDVFSQNLPLLSNRTLHLWRGEAIATVETTIGSMNVFPFAAVQVLSNQDISSIFSKLDKDQQIWTQRLKELIETINKITGSLGKDDQNPASASSLISPPTMQKDEASETQGDKNLKLESILSNLYRGDAAAFVLFSRLATSMQLPQLCPDAHLSLTSIQKKGNVLYIQEQWQLSGSNVQGISEKRRYLVDRETFVVTSPNGIFLVLTQVPSIDGRSETFAWISEWLAGLRIPLDGLAH